MWVTESRRFVISFTCPTSRKTRPWKQRTLVFVRIHPRTSLPVSQNETAEPRRHLIQRVVISRCPTRHRVLGRLGPSCAELLKFISHNDSPPSIWRFAYAVLIAFLSSTGITTTVKGVPASSLTVGS